MKKIMSVLILVIMIGFTGSVIGQTYPTIPKRYRAMIDISDDILKCDGNQIKEGDPVKQVIEFCGQPSRSNPRIITKSVYFWVPGFRIGKEKTTEELSLIYHRFDNLTLTGLTVIVLIKDEKVDDIEIIKRKLRR